MKLFAIFLLTVSSVLADTYLHNPRGSNNRLDEEGRERNNANRMFDSQNNNRGGYNVGSVYYYSKTKLMVEWTNQHSCNNPNSHCEIILQYMCGANVRDGVTTATIPDNPTQCQNMDCTTDTRYGMHENLDYYLKCKLRERNMGLFTADQNLNGKNRAKNTRQNPNGIRRAYECPEERDYYPYWHPTPWKDIAVMTNDATRCRYYQAESENVRGRWECVVPRALLYTEANNNQLVIPNNREDCEAFRWPKNDANGLRANWTQVASHGLPAPDCLESQFSRDNHLGNTKGGYPASYNWTLPDLDESNCAMRVRYNISTDDYAGWNTTASSNKQQGSNSANIDLSQGLGFASQEAAAQRGYTFKNNPEVEIFPGVGNKMALRLAVNTAQYGRTFQDRSFTFAIKERPENLKDAVIQNINVRGKRGNIVQVYPAVEYDFVPNTLEASVGQYVHFQWTGSNTNPQNNDGQGRAGTDRSNLVLQMDAAYSEGSGLAYRGTTKYGHWGRSYPSPVPNTTLAGLSQTDLSNLALLTNRQFRGEMSELDDAGTYYDLGPRKVTAAGVYHYMSTRNNNFSNRSQKGRLVVKQGVSAEVRPIGWNGGNFTLQNGKAALFVERGAVSQRTEFAVETWDREEGTAQLTSLNRKLPSDNLASDFLVIHPEGRVAGEGWTFLVEMSLDASMADEVVIYRSSTESPAWTRVPARIAGDTAFFDTYEGGVYIGVGHTKSAVVAGAVVGCLLLVAVLVIAAVVYLRKNPEKLARMKSAFVSKV